MKKLKVTWKGVTPLIMHSCRTVNPIHTLTRAMKAYTSKRTKTDDDYADMSDLEWLQGAYIDGEDTTRSWSVMDYGASLTHHQIADGLGVRYPSTDYRYAVDKVKKQLLEVSKHLESIHGVGYAITSPDDYSAAAIRKYKQGTKRFKQGLKVLDFAPVDKMSEHGLTEYRNVKDRTTALTAHVAGTMIEIKLLKRQPHPLEAARSQ